MSNDKPTKPRRGRPKFKTRQVEDINGEYCSVTVVRGDKVKIWHEDEDGTYTYRELTPRQTMRLVASLASAAHYAGDGQ